MLKEGTQALVRYRKELCPPIDGNDAIYEDTNRAIIPTRVPKPQTNVKALDVTSLSDSERKAMILAWEQYGEYIGNAMRTLFTFEDFIAHQGILVSDIKWRTFKSNQLEEL